MRTPLLPFDEYERWSHGLLSSNASGESLDGAIAEDRRVLRSRLAEIVDRPAVREAIFIASTDLDESIDVWKETPNTERGQKIERALVRYFSRMTTRPTPFGLFAGGATGSIAKKSSLSIATVSEHVRSTRLDMDYLSALCEGLTPYLADSLRWRPNSSLYEAGGRLRYAHSRMMNKIRTYHLVALEPTDYLLETLNRARLGARAKDLAEALVDEEISYQEAREYIGELISSQVLVSSLSPPVTGQDAVEVLTSVLNSSEAEQVANTLESAVLHTEKIDAEGIGVDPGKYRDVAQMLEPLPAKVEMARLFQVDLRKSSDDLTLGQSVLGAISKGVVVAHSIFGRESDMFANFVARFMNRYEMQEMPLTEVLDEETGIGFSERDNLTSEASPLLDGLAFPPAAAGGGEWLRLHEFLFRKVMNAVSAGEVQISLSDSDLEHIKASNPAPIPDAFQVMVTIYADGQEALDKGNFKVLFNGAAGPPGSRLLGRFCSDDEELEGLVRSHLRAEESLDTGAIFAEIAHLPEGRLGNVLHRPVLRDYEIVFLGESGAPRDRQIEISDLWVRIRGSRVVLWSRRLDKEVIPRLSTAHNFTLRSLGLYRFLCSLQSQGVSGAVSWSWGPLDSADFLPRVVVGNIILTRARWNVSKSEIDALLKSKGNALFASVRKWREERHIPRIVVHEDEDNELFVDFENVLSMESFLHTVKNRTVIRLDEHLSGLVATSPEGRFAHELVLPFIRVREATAEQVGYPFSHGAQRKFLPGDSIAYFKFYTATSSADSVLKDVVRPIIDHLGKPWFFIRFSDPDHHVRLRLQTEASHELAAFVREVAEPLIADGRIWKIQTDTYEREIERYGGGQGIELCEAAFNADSECVLRIVELLSGDEGTDARWRLTLRGIDMILNDFGLDLEGKRGVMRNLRDQFLDEFRADGAFRNQLSERFRARRPEMNALLDPRKDEASDLEPGFDALKWRSSAWAAPVAGLIDLKKQKKLTAPLTDVVGSLIHMHANRLLRSAQRAQELVIYDMLDRLYLSSARRD